MRARHLCAVLGVAVAVGTVVFMRSLVETNDHQSLAVAERLLQAVPVAPDAQLSRFSLDWRPNGRVMQGPPMMAFVATGVPLGLSVKTSECVITRALFAQRRLPVPPAGTELTLVGRRSAHRLKVAAVLDWERPLRGYPNVFVSFETAADIDEAWTPWEARSAAELALGFMGQENRNFDRARALLLWAAALTALCLLVNTLLLSVEARRKEIAVRRMVGETRAGVVRSVLSESLALTLVGCGAGCGAGIALLFGFVAVRSETYPLGAAFSLTDLIGCIVAAAAVALIAALVALRPALAVRPLEAASVRPPRPRRLGMLIAFACGFGAFVAVEVWGASLMSAFVPSPEWPDAIVSILPGGVSSFDIEKLQGALKGVREIHELLPLQVNLEPLEPLAQSKRAKGRGEGEPRRPQFRNALLLGSDWLPPFRFVAGTREEALAAVGSGDACVITEMMARARNLRLGDKLLLDCGRGLRMSLDIVGIVDLNWHMVTSRALVRGLNRMPSNTDGPVFVSFDTVEACDGRPAELVKMTHLWLDYEPDFLDAHGVFAAGRIVEREIAEALGVMTDDADANTVRLHARDEVADGTLAHGADIIGAMALVPFVFILVVSLGFVAMLVASADARRREFAVLRAVGATRGQLARILAGEALKVATAGIAVGLSGGALVGWLATSGTRAAMSNWGIPPNFALPMLTLAKGALGAVFFALLVAVPTSLALVRPRHPRVDASK